MTVYANHQRTIWGLLGHRSLLCAIVVAAAFSASAAHAQFRTSIQGTVTDPSGAVIPGATLTLTDTDTNHVVTATSNTSGVYNFNALPTDHFNLTVLPTTIIKPELMSIMKQFAITMKVRCSLLSHRLRRSL